MSFTLSADSGETGPVQWLIENRVLQFKFDLFFGRGDAGKSNLVTRIIGDWHNDSSMTGERKLKRVLWLTEEEGLTAKVKPRLYQYGLTEDQIVTINYHTGECAKPILPQDHDKFVTLLKDNRINCVVIDPWTELLHGDWSVFQPEDMRPYINGLNRVCLAARATILGIGHVRKASGGHSSDDMLGCRQIMDSTRCVNRVDKTEELKPRHFFAVQKCNDADPTNPMQFAFEPKINGFSKVVWKGEFDGTISDIKSMSESKVKRSKLDDAKRMLTEALKDGPKTAKELGEEIKNNLMCHRTVDEAKIQMGVKSTRKVNQDGVGYWIWTMPTAEELETSSTPGEPPVPQLTVEDLPEFKPQPLLTLSQENPETGLVEEPKRMYPPVCKNKIGWDRQPSVCHNMAGKGGYCHGCKDMIAHFKKIDKEAKAVKKPRPKKAQAK